MRLRAEYRTDPEGGGPQFHFDDWEGVAPGGDSPMEDHLIAADLHLSAFFYHMGRARTGPGANPALNHYHVGEKARALYHALTGALRELRHILGD